MLIRISKLSLFSRAGLLLVISLTTTIPGCKKEAPPPTPVTPLPKKTVQAALGTVAPVAAVKPLQSAPSSARKTVTPGSAQNAVQNQVPTAQPPPTKPVGVSLDFTSKRDPFKPYVQVPVKPQGRAKNRTSDPLPIQKFDTEKFSVSGIITGIKENSALVIDPSGKGHIVKAGMPFGVNDGRVKRITSSAIEVEESFRDDFGRVKKRLVKLTLLRKK